MSYALNLQPKPSQSLKQMQRMIMSRQMQQAIHLLQMPIMELSAAIEGELEQNPVLEYLENETVSELEAIQTEEENTDEVSIDASVESELQFDQHDFETLRRLDEDFRSTLSETSGTNGKNTIDQEKLHNFLESSIQAEISLFEHLMQQARETFDHESDRILVEALIGNFNENGFLTTPLQEIAVLHACEISKLETLLASVQTFDPPGVGARNLRESLLIQLRLQNKKSTLAYKIIEAHFDDLLHNRIPKIKKSLQCTSTQFTEMLDQHIIKLDLHPGMCFSKQIVSTILPEAFIRQEDDQLIVNINEDSLPPLRLNKRYLQMLEDKNLSKDDKDFIQQKVVSAKWLVRNLFQRNNTIERITQELAKRQREFFLHPEGKLTPLTMKVIAEALELHESTIARAVSQKYIETPRGLLPLRSFFTSAIETHTGENLSSQSVKDLMRELIKNENKNNPLSDEAIARVIKEQGIHCARRTVAKYRLALNIGSSQQRRKF
ncbi:MAG: RNA polymerase factor sigma-54 [Parachlamydiaceae bacterium]|nr:RNA polymerase factor sigma-54 [Parachlamydiaceae bacterium]